MRTEIAVAIASIKACFSKNLDETMYYHVSEESREHIIEICNLLGRMVNEVSDQLEDKSGYNEHRTKMYVDTLIKAACLNYLNGAGVSITDITELLETNHQRYSIVDKAIDTMKAIKSKSMKDVERYVTSICETETIDTLRRHRHHYRGQHEELKKAKQIAELTGHPTDYSYMEADRAYSNIDRILEARIDTLKQAEAQHGSDNA